MNEIKIVHTFPLATNLEGATLNNNDFRRVLHTSENMQVVMMCLKPGEDVGMEVHEHTEQFFRMEEGSGKAVIGNDTVYLVDGSFILVPKNTRHNVINTGGTPLKFYTIYSPPMHKPCTVHRTKWDALHDPNEH